MNKRVIKFRAWDGKCNIMRYEKISFEELEWGVEVLDADPYYYFSLPWPRRFTWMQFIGLKDKEGREIYEGDICKLDAGLHFKGEVVGYVNYCVERACYRLLSSLDTDIYQIDMHFLDEKAPLREGAVYSTERTCKIACDKIEVVGNIFENKELLNERN
jgi:uncharacterized phage protein (TIGR01671 family)